jgi:hypothetical protein
MGFQKLGFDWGDAGQGAQLARASSSLDRALVDAPNKSSAWLMLAGVASRIRLAGIDAEEALKMSYYTGSRELDLMPLRLWITDYSTFGRIQRHRVA